MAGTATRLLARDSTGAICGEFPADVAAELELRDKDLSTWSVHLPARSEARDLLPESDKAGGLVVVRDLLDDAGRVTDTGTLFSGFWTSQGIRRAPTGEDSGPGRWVISGVDDLYLLSRVAYPVPGSALASQGGSEVYTDTGQASAVMRALVDANAGPGALTAREVAGLSLAVDPAIGSTVTVKARMEPILEHLRTLAAQGGDLGYRVVWQGPGSYEFQVYEGVDRSGDVQFSWGQGTLRGYEYQVRAPTATAVISGGSGEGIGRIFTEDVALDGWPRLEEFVDSGTAEDDPASTTAGADALRDKGQSYELRVDLVDMPDLRYGRDFGLLDRVTVADDDAGVLVVDAVRGVRVSVSAAGDVLAPFVGSETVDTDRPDQRVLRRLVRHLRTYQTR